MFCAYVYNCSHPVKRRVKETQSDMAVSNQATGPEEGAAASVAHANGRGRPKQEPDEEEQDDDDVEAELDEEEAARNEARRLRTAIAEATGGREELQQRNTKWVLTLFRVGQLHLRC